MIMMKLVNLTPHEIYLMPEEGKILSIPSSGTVARCEVRREKIGSLSVDGIDVPVNKTVFGQVENLPEPEEDIIYIVFSIVAQAVAQSAPDRTDVVIVDDAIRNEKGQIIEARALARIAP